jgi:hypothetical protein
MKRHVLMYGLIGGILIALLQWTEYQFLVVEHSIEIYGGLIAATFAVLGIWLGLKLTVKRQPIVVREPRLVEQEGLGGAEVLGVSDFIRCPVQNVKQQWFQDFRGIVPAVEIKCLKALERKRVLGVVEEEPVLSIAGPAVQPFL